MTFQPLRCKLPRMADTPAAPSPAPTSGRSIKKVLLRRCAKCATPKAESHFKAGADMTPYCTDCRTRFPSIAAARIVRARPIRPHGKATR